MQTLYSSVHNRTASAPESALCHNIDILHKYLPHTAHLSVDHKFSKMVHPHKHMARFPPVCQMDLSDRSANGTLLLRRPVPVTPDIKCLSPDLPRDILPRFLCIILQSYFCLLFQFPRSCADALPAYASSSGRILHIHNYPVIPQIQ